MLHIYAECKNKPRRESTYDKSESYVSFGKNDGRGGDTDEERIYCMRTFVLFALCLLLAAGGFAIAVYEVFLLHLFPFWFYLIFFGLLILSDFHKNKILLANSQEFHSNASILCPITGEVNSHFFQVFLK